MSDAAAPTRSTHHGTPWHVCGARGEIVYSASGSAPSQGAGQRCAPLCARSSWIDIHGILGLRKGGKEDDAALLPVLELTVIVKSVLTPELEARVVQLGHMYKETCEQIKTAWESTIDQPHI